MTSTDASTLWPDLPDDLSSVLEPLIQFWPPEQAMDKLVTPMQFGHDELVQQVEAVLQSESLKDRPDLAAGLWLYVDELDRSHRFSQSMGDQTGAYWHAIMHRREGDFGNAQYWFRRTGEHPAMDRVAGPEGGAYAPADFINRVERAYEKKQNNESTLVGVQRVEWARLFEWCAGQ